MKKIIILSVLFIGCGEGDTEKFDRFMTELESPVILIGKTDKAVNYPSIVVKDGKGRVRTFSYTDGGLGGSSGLPHAIAESRKIGDTLK